MPPAPSDAPVGRASGPTSRPDARVGAPEAEPSRRRRPALPRRAHPAAGPSARPPAAPARVRAHPKPALETLLADLGPRIQRGPAREAVDAAPGARFHPTGLAALDALLGGGFPHGRLSEICGAPGPAESSSGRSVGRTALALALAAETLSRGVLVAWVDLADAFDPGSALEAIRERGGPPADLDRLLWIRARSEGEALRCCERVMRTEGFELVVFDAFPPVPPPGPARPGPRDVTWLRLARLALSTRTALVALTDLPRVGARAELVLEMQGCAARFGAPPHLLESVEIRAVLRRHRSRPAGGTTLQLHAEDEPGEARGD